MRKKYLFVQIATRTVTDAIRIIGKHIQGLAFLIGDIFSKHGTCSQANIRLRNNFIFFEQAINNAKNMGIAVPIENKFFIFKLIKVIN